MNGLDINKKTKTALCKLISEEWIAANLYEQMILGCNPDERHIISDLFVKTSLEEKNDHYTKLINFAAEHDIDIPCKIDDYEKYAAESVFKQFMTWKKDKDASYYIEQALLSEIDAINSYTEIINDEDVCEDLKRLILEMYYDEIEHHSLFSTLNIANSIGSKLKI